MAKRKLSAKQIKFFGTPRQKAALKSSRKRKASAKKRTHRPAAKRANPSRKRAVARSKTNSSHRPRKRAAKKNPGEIISLVLGNPSRRSGKKAMATTKKKSAGARRNSAGRPRKVYMKKKRSTHRKRSNPGALGSTGSWLVGGVGILGGVVVSRSLPQLVLGSSNAGPLGYVANAATAVIGGFLLNSIGAGRKFAIPFVGGGFAGLIARIIGDYTPYGKVVALSGWGDYQFSNIVGTVPQRLVNMNSAVTEWGAPGNAALSVSRGGGDIGVRGGNC